MIAHTGLAVSDYAASKAFYERVLAPLGYRNNMEHGQSGGFNDGKNTDFWIGQSQSVQPMHVAFEAKSRDEVESFYKAALSAGGRDNGRPGYRKDYWPGYYAAFVYDPDGHNLLRFAVAHRSRSGCAGPTQYQLQTGGGNLSEGRHVLLFQAEPKLLRIKLDRTCNVLDLIANASQADYEPGRTRHRSTSGANPP